MTIFKRILNCFVRAWKPALKAAFWLLKITIPVSLLVTIMNYTGIIAFVGKLMDPFFSFIGLPGHSGIVYITSALLNIYTAIAAISSLPFNMREVTILALMCLIAHNLITETIIQKKTGSNPIQMVLLRILVSFLAGYLLNLLLPDSLAQKMNMRLAAQLNLDWITLLKNWLIDISLLSLKIILIVNGLMIIHRILEEFNLFSIISFSIAPLIKMFGLPLKTSFLWIIGNIVGLTYGGAIMIDEVNRGELRKKHANYLNHHLAISHSTLEDTLLFVAIGVPLFWILIPRVALAVIVVWILRLVNRRRLKKLARIPL